MGNMIAFTGTGSAVTMTSIELVDFINAHRKQQAEDSGYIFPSREFAKLEHADFLKKVPLVLGSCAGNFTGTYKVPGPRGGYRELPLYTFPKRESCLMAMSYSYDIQAKVFDHMTQLEEQISAGLPVSYSESLRMLADSHDRMAVVLPKAMAFDAFANEDGVYLISQVSRQCNMRDDTLTDLLTDKNGLRWLYRDSTKSPLKCCQEKMREGLVTTRKGQVRITSKGLNFLLEMFSREKLNSRQSALEFFDEKE